MATFHLPIINAHTIPDTNGDTYFEPSNVAAGVDRYNHIVLAFTSQSARRGVYGKFAVPQNYVGSADLIVRWFTTATSGDVVFDVDYTAITISETYDPAGDQETATVTDTADATARDLNTASIALTDGNFAAGDEVQFYLVRDAADAADTLAATAWVTGVYFQYADA